MPVRFKGQREGSSPTMSGEECERSQRGLWVIARPLCFILSGMGAVEGSEHHGRDRSGCCTAEDWGARIEAGGHLKKLRFKASCSRAALLEPKLERRPDQSACTLPCCSFLSGGRGPWRLASLGQVLRKSGMGMGWSLSLPSAPDGFPESSNRGGPVSPGDPPQVCLEV